MTEAGGVRLCLVGDKDGPPFNEVEHTRCHKLLFKWSVDGLLIFCGRCKDEVLVPWRQVVMMWWGAVV